jgi:hypothetical protein
VQSQGPRFETKAEIKSMALQGDVVGMTCGHEATLCAELHLPYALVCMCDNMANGLQADDTAIDTAFHAGVTDNTQRMDALLDALLRVLVEDVDTKNAETVTDDKTDNDNDADVAMSDSSKPPSSSSSSPPRRRVDLLVHARYVVPVLPDDTVLVGGAKM